MRLSRIVAVVALLCPLIEPTTPHLYAVSLLGVLILAHAHMESLREERAAEAERVEALVQGSADPVGDRSPGPGSSTKS
jgi:hypothetical protein